jgi:hypothetical protein
VSELGSLFGRQVQRGVNMYDFFESIKNTLTGKLHYPHAKFIDYGAHSITIEGVGGEKKSKS